MRLWLVMFALLGSAAFAAPRPRVVLSGPAAITRWASKELARNYTPITAKDAVAAMPTAGEVREVTGPAHAIALVLCQSGGQFITLQVLSGHDGTPLDTVTVKGTQKKLPRTMPKPALAALMFAIGSGRAPGPDAAAPVAPVAVAVAVAEKPAPSRETPAPVVKVEPKKESAPARQASPPPVKQAPPTVAEAPAPLAASSHPALRASVGVGGFNRSFGWAGNPSPSLSRGDQPFSGEIAVEASWYPAAHFTSNFASNLGLFVAGDFGVGMVSVVDKTSRFAHTSTRLRFGGLVRLPLGERFTLHLHLGYSRHELSTSAVALNDGSARPNLPDVLFNGLRGGLGVRLRLFGTVELDASGGFQLVSGKGELGSARFFPQATAFAVDAGGGLSVQLVEHVRLRGGAEWQRYFVTLNPAENSTFFARTAADQYLTFVASLQWVM